VIERRHIMMILGVTTCDKCGMPMKKDQKIVTIGLGTVTEANTEIEVPEPEIRYACHFDCWYGVEELYNMI
jgi:hypothetical protein